jgi:hypothetical protein
MVVDEALGGLLRAEVLNRVRPQYIAHQPMCRRLPKPVNLRNCVRVPVMGCF